LTAAKGKVAYGGMSNVLSDEKRQQIIALGRLGWPLRRIERATGVRRETVGGYLKAAGIAVGGRGRQPAEAKPAIEVITDSQLGESPKPANKVTTDSGAPAQPSEATKSTRSISASEPYRELIEAGLNRGRNAMAIWQDLVSQYGFDHGYHSVRRFIHKLQPRETSVARPAIITPPGEEAQVDYGTGPMVLEKPGGKYRRTRLFVFTLGYSRKAVRFLVFRSSAHIWAELHEKAFRRLGGAVRILVLDNLREGVLTPDIYDPVLNPLYRDLLAHYGAVAMPCRVRDPDRKAYVSYCTLCRFCNDESWLFGTSTSDTFDDRLVIQRFVKTASVIIVALLLQQSLSSPGSDCRRSHTELCAHFSSREQSFRPQPVVTAV